MLSTPQLLDLLREANPRRSVTEDMIRRALRSNPHLRPSRFGHCFAWTPDQVRSLAEHLALDVPDLAVAGQNNS